MPDQITANDRMVYVGAKPWHDKGKIVDPSVVKTVEQTIEFCNMGWTVRTERLSLLNPVTLEWQNVDRYAVVRSTDGKVLSTVGAGYRCIQNKQALELLTPFLDAGEATIETAGTLFDGARVWILAKVNRPGQVIVPKADDVVQSYILAATGHDGSLATHVGCTAVRVVCDNTLQAAVKGGGKLIRIRHGVGAGEAIKAAHDACDRAAAEFGKAGDLFRALAGKYVSAKQIREYIDAVFPPPKGKPAPEVKPAARFADASEWDDGPTSPDIGAPALEMIDLPESKPADAGNPLASLLAKPVALSWQRNDVEAQFARMSADRERSETTETRRIHDNIVEIFESGGRRGDLNMEGVKGTAWAAYNAVTEYLTWDRGGSPDNRLNNLWFQGSNGVGARALSAAASTFLK